MTQRFGLAGYVGGVTKTHTKAVAAPFHLDGGAVRDTVVKRLVDGRVVVRTADGQLVTRMGA